MYNIYIFVVDGTQFDYLSLIYIIMKKYLFFVFILFLAVGCSKDNNGKLDSNALISLRPAPGVKSETNPSHLTALEIVEHTLELSFQNLNLLPDGGAWRRGFSDAQRDFDPVSPRLLMWGTDIIDQEGQYVGEFIEGEDFVLTRLLSINPYKLDTIAYVPNSIIRIAETAIKSAYARKDYRECYRIFDTAFTFTPITGAEWRALKALDQN